MDVFLVFIPVGSAMRRMDFILILAILKKKKKNIIQISIPELVTVIGDTYASHV